MFKQATQRSWEWAKDSNSIRWFTDGERRYAKQLWSTASIYLRAEDYSPGYGHRKVWREGLEIAIKVKSSQGRKRVTLVKPEHPNTAISPASQVNANHNEAHDSALRRRCSAYRRRANTYAKKVKTLQRTLTVQRLVHNWVSTHWGLGKTITPAMALKLSPRSIKVEALLACRGFSFVTS